MNSWGKTHLLVTKHLPKIFITTDYMALQSDDSMLWVSQWYQDLTWLHISFWWSLDWYGIHAFLILKTIKPALKQTIHLSKGWCFDPRPLHSTCPSVHGQHTETQIVLDGCFNGLWGYAYDWLPLQISRWHLVWMWVVNRLEKRHIRKCSPFTI